MREKEIKQLILDISKNNLKHIQKTYGYSYLLNRLL